MDTPLSTMDVSCNSSEKLISVIIPVYNTYKYLNICLDSLRYQTYKFFEAIIVDDGSDDNSERICTLFSMLDNRFKLIRTKHVGIAAARNIALEQVTGDFIAFIDSDDSVKSDYLATLLHGMTLCGADISVCSWHELQENFHFVTVPRGRRKLSRFMAMDGISALEKLLYQKGVDNSLWCKLWKADLFQDMRFPDGKLYEDFQIVYKLFAKARKVCFTNYKAYNYLLRSNGEIRREFVPDKMDLIDAADDMFAYIYKHFPTLRPAMLSRFIRANFHIYLQIPDEKIYDLYIKRIENNIIIHRSDVLFDKQASLRTKAALLLTYPNFAPFRLLRRLKTLKKVRQSLNAI